MITFSRPRTSAAGASVKYFTNRSGAGFRYTRVDVVGRAPSPHLSGSRFRRLVSTRANGLRIVTAPCRPSDRLRTRDGLGTVLVRERCESVREEKRRRETGRFLRFRRRYGRSGPTTTAYGRNGRTSDETADAVSPRRVPRAPETTVPDAVGVRSDRFQSANTSRARPLVSSPPPTGQCK